MSEQFPFPCAMCGACCIAITCPVAEMLFRPEAIIDGHCPALRSDDASGTVYCALAIGSDKFKEMLSIGVGCCLRGRAINTETGIEVDYASLPNEVKKKLVSLTAAGHISIISTRVYKEEEKV